MRNCWLTLLVLAVAIPDDAEGAFRVRDATVYARREASTGLTWYMARRGRPTLELGWGYDGAAEAAGAYAHGRYLIAWPFFDPWGGRPTIHVVLVADDRVLDRHEHYFGFCIDERVVSVTARGDGWLLRHKCGEDGAIEERELDRGGCDLGTLYTISTSR